MSGIMYLEAKSSHSQPFGFYLDEGQQDMIIDLDNSGDLLLTDEHQNHQHLFFTESSGEEQGEKFARRKRAETWVQEETQNLIGLRRELDELFNTSKSNKHLWELISAKMRGKGFERSPSMCNDKWRNLLKAFKKAKRREARDRGGGSSSKMSYHADIEEFYKGRKKVARENNVAPWRDDCYIQFSDEGIDNASILPFGLYEDSGRSTLNFEGGLEHDGPPLGICEAEGVAANGVPTWNWRETPASGVENESAYSGRVISVKWGECTKSIGIDASSKAIKEAIKAAFGLRTNRAFWLEDETGVVRSLDRDMPLRIYNLRLDKGKTIKICLFDDPNHMPPRAEEKTFYCEDDFRSFLNCRGWIGLKDRSCCKNVDSIDELHPGEMYYGLRMLGNKILQV